MMYIGGTIVPGQVNHMGDPIKNGVGMRHLDYVVILQ